MLWGPIWGKWLTVHWLDGINSDLNKDRVGRLDVLSKRQFVLSGSDEPSVCGEETMFLYLFSWGGSAKVIDLLRGKSKNKKEN